MSEPIKIEEVLTSILEELTVLRQKNTVNVVFYDHTKFSNPIDYSEKVTEPDRALTMKEIYTRFVVSGGDVSSIPAGLKADRAYNDDDIEEDIDIPRMAMQSFDNVKDKVNKSETKPKENSEEVKAEVGTTEAKANEPAS